MARTNRRSLEANAPVVGKVNLMTQFCFATDIRRPERLISGNRNVPRRVEERGQAPKGCGLSSLAIELVQSGHSDKISSLRAFMDFAPKRGSHQQACGPPYSNRLWTGWKRYRGE